MSDDAGFALPAELDLAAAGPLRANLLRLLAPGQAVVADGAAVERVSTACLQVLVAAARDRQPFRIVNPSQVLAEAARDLALHELLPMGS